MGDMRRVCLLTGASGTFGRAFISRCAADYHIVAVHHWTPIDFATQDQIFIDPLQPAADIPANDAAVYAIRADLSHPEEIARVVGESLAAFGRIDWLVNAAARRGWSPLLSPAALASAASTLDLNVLVPMRLAVEVAQRFWRADPEANIANRRSVVNISSTAGLFVYPDCGQAVYATSKAALNHLTYHMASEFWDLGVRVNAVAPDTFPGRVPTEDVLDAVLAFDRSDKSGEITSIMGPPT
jgi:NAD(P)-dependent dehydrogenase (short-subunit alcohol dehydrogenase family)